MAETASPVADCAASTCRMMSADAVAVSRGQFLHLVGDDGEAPPGLPRAGRLDRGIEREQVRLGGDRGDDRDRVLDLLRRALECRDGRQRVVDLGDRGGRRLGEGTGRRAELGRRGSDVARDLVDGLGGPAAALLLLGDAGRGLLHRGAGRVDRSRATAERAGHAADEELTVVTTVARGGERRTRLAHERVGHVDEAVDRVADLDDVGEGVGGHRHAGFEIARCDPPAGVGDRRERGAVRGRLVAGLGGPGGLVLHRTAPFCSASDQTNSS